MPSSFPRRDPYLEGYLWPDVHHRLATQISDQLMPLLRPRYVARIEIQVVPDETPEADIGIMYLDVEIVRARESESALPSGSTTTGALTAASQSITPAALSVPLLAIEVRLATAFTTIYDRAAYDLSLHYAARPPPPPLSAEEHTWVQQRTEGRVR